MKRDTFIGLGVAVSVHLGALIGLNAVLLEKPEFGIAVGENSVEVDLVAAAPTPLAESLPPKPPPEQAPKEPLPPPQPDSLILPAPLPEPPPNQPQPSTAQPPPHPPSSPPPTEGNASISLHNQGGARTEARPDYLQNPPPRYPERARRMGQQGVVLLRVEVDVDGRASRVSLQKSSGYDILDLAAIDSVRTWRFKPAAMQGTAMKTEVEIPIRFELKR